MSAVAEALIGMTLVAQLLWLALEAWWLRRLTALRRLGWALFVLGPIMLHVSGGKRPWAYLGIASGVIGYYLIMRPPDDWWRRRRRQAAAALKKTREALAWGIPAPQAGQPA